MNPVISINIPCYNRSGMLKECIQSFINQTFKDFELVIADDGSDEDLTFVKSMDPRIKYIRQDHKGISAALNLALDNSSGKYVMPFGSDDLATDNRLLEIMLYELERMMPRGYHAVYNDQWNLDQNGKKIRRKHPHAHQSFKSEEYYKMMLTRQCIAHGGTLWIKEYYPRHDETLESAVDLELFLTALENGVKFYHVPIRLWTYRVGHPREEKTKRQTECCDRILRKRGYYFDKEKRKGFPICN